jgi:hypothetical protein
MSKSWVAGLGAIAFVVLTIAASFIDNGPGGTYKASDVAKYLERGHRPAVFASAFVMLLGITALLFLLARLREVIADARWSSVFWGLSVAGAGAFLAGWALHMAVPVAMAYGGESVKVAPPVAYVISEAGFLVLAAGAALIGVALLALVGAGVELPRWVRGVTVVGAIGALAALAWFPFVLFFLWALVVGIWLIATRPAPSVAPIPA